jgi:Tfp pilus assembly protein PilO
MNAFASNPAIALIKRHKFASFCTITSLVLLVAIWVLRLDLHTMVIQTREHDQDNQAMLSTLASGPLIKQELARAQEIVQRIESNLVVESKLEDNVAYFYKLQKETKADIVFLKQQPADNSNDWDYKVVPYNLQLSGTYEQVAAFMLALETGPKLSQIKLFAFRRLEAGANRISLTIDLKLLGKR